MRDQCVLHEPYAGCTPPTGAGVALQDDAVEYSCAADASNRFCSWRVSLSPNQQYELLVERFDYPAKTEQIEVALNTLAHSKELDDGYFSRSTTQLEVEGKSEVVIRVLALKPSPTKTFGKQHAATMTASQASGSRKCSLRRGAWPSL